MNFKPHISIFIATTLSVISLSSCSIFETRFGNCAKIAEKIMRASLKEARSIGDKYIETIRVSDMSGGVVYLFIDRTGDLSIEQESKDLMGFYYADGLIDSPNKVVCPAGVAKTIVTESELGMRPFAQFRKYVLTEENGKITYGEK
jgi:hypothetical protein